MSRVWNDNFVGAFCSRSMVHSMANQRRWSSVSASRGGSASVARRLRNLRSVVRCAIFPLVNSARKLSCLGDHDGPLADSYFAARMEMTAL